MKNTFSCLLTFSCRNNHTCVRYGNSDAGNDLGKYIVINSVIKRICINIICMTESRNTDRMRPNPKCCFKVFSMHQKTCKFVTIFVQTKEYTDSDIVNAAFHSTIHSLCVVVIIMFWSCRMQFQIALFMISFLE